MLYAVIGAVARGPDLDRVLPAVVDLLVDATACHACFVYLREDDELVVRAASPVFAHAVGTVRMRLDEGLTGWVATRAEPAFIRDAALDDPRMKYFPELEEERFQSMVAVPLMAQDGEVIGVVVLHTVAPREFEQDVLEFLQHVASLVAGAIDNARLYEQTRRQVALLSSIAAFGEELASLTDTETLYQVGCRGVRRLLRADGCVLVVQRENRGRVRVAADPEDAEDTLIHDPGHGRLATRLLDGDTAFGALGAVRSSAFAPDEQRLLESCAHQLAIALRKAELIERLAAGNLVRDLFLALRQGDVVAAAARARLAGFDATQPHAVVAVLPKSEDESRWEVELGARVDASLRVWTPDAMSDIGPHRLTALVPVAREDRLNRIVEQLDDASREHGVATGISQLRTGIAESVASVREADDAALLVRALLPGGGARAYATLGPYRYLAALAESDVPESPHAVAIATLDDYDKQRGTVLLGTLEQFLHDRGVTATSRRLLVHPNTLRQRLQRIETLTGLSLETEDLLSLELALKAHRLGR
jgi:GAF domain-containing protein